MEKPSIKSSPQKKEFKKRKKKNKKTVILE